MHDGVLRSLLSPGMRGVVSAHPSCIYSTHEPAARRRRGRGSVVEENSNQNLFHSGIPKLAGACVAAVGVGVVLNVAVVTFRVLGVSGFPVGEAVGGARGAECGGGVVFEAPVTNPVGQMRAVVIGHACIIYHVEPGRQGFSSYGRFPLTATGICRYPSEQIICSVSKVSQIMLSGKSPPPTVHIQFSSIIG